MAGILDTAGDLIHRAYNAMTGESKETPPPKAPYTKIDATMGGAAGDAAKKVGWHQDQLDKAIDDQS